ncbi:potassium channel family protein [Tautonia plasticadhaerens]|uniref:TrkA-N domain protein n=1 Tax=Tautonia plasticadhaerens TaxID=2527974 RepID=A0A518GX89_9BACT|nr:potassium channel protein [Tautonia plasticadhaerens]QDV33208.1 TrkA-N domain protein [Tautonia plasticadhaerens]
MTRIRQAIAFGRPIGRRSRKKRSLKARLLKALTSWNRHQVSRIVGMTLLIWVLGAVGLLAVEGKTNPDFASFPEALWSVWILLFSGPDEPPGTWAGRLIVMLLQGVGVGLVGLFTASVASILIERYLRRREVDSTAMDNHIVLCNWATRGSELIRQVHSRIVTDWRPIVIIHDQPDEIELPDKADETAFTDVYIVKGDPTSEVALRRAGVARAYSVVVLVDSREGKHADGKTILTCVSIRNICKGDDQPNVVAECLNPGNRIHLRKAGADEVVSAHDIGLRLLARASLFHGMIRVYQELLTVRKDNNELYVVPVPEALVGKGFEELSVLFARTARGDPRGCVLIGVQREEEMMINPIGEEAGPTRADDLLVVLSRKHPKLEDLFPA